MVKVVYYKSLGRKRYKKRLFRYLYRKNKTYANRIGLNYYSSIIHFELNVFKKNNSQGNAGLGWMIGSLNRSTEFPNGFSLSNNLAGDAEYTNYTNIFDDVKLLGISMVSVPVPYNMSNNLSSHIPVTVQFKNDGLTAQGGQITLNPFGVTKKYWKNINRKWVPCSLTLEQITAGNAIPGLFVLNSVTDTTTQQNSPSWNLTLKIYLRFRKNKNL